MSVTVADASLATQIAAFQTLILRMNATRALRESSADGFFHPDRVGVIASVLCAIHCAATPLIFLFAPAFGQVWTHPASHWMVALFVVPMAGVMVARGFRKHRRISVAAAGIAGMALVIAGAGIPYWEALGNENFASTPANSEVSCTASPGSDETAAEESPGKCAADPCCPTLTVDDCGDTELVIPLASVVTTLGGILLICAHVGNLCCCATCGSPPKSGCQLLIET